MTDEQFDFVVNQFMLLNNLAEDVLAEAGTLVAADEYPAELRQDVNLLFEKLEKIEALLAK